MRIAVAVECGGGAKVIVLDARRGVGDWYEAGEELPACPRYGGIVRPTAR